MGVGVLGGGGGLFGVGGLGCIMRTRGIGGLVGVGGLGEISGLAYVEVLGGYGD